MMKKILLALAVIALSAGIASAQDLATATETYNNGAEQLNLGQKASALSTFQEALKIGEALGEEGAELVANCKKVIPGVILSLGKEAFNDKDFATALEHFNKAVTVAEEYGETETAEEAKTLIGQAAIANDLNAGNTAFSAKDFAAAAEAFKKVLAADSTHANASLRLVQSLANLGDLAAAKEALALAQTNGQGENAAKVLGGAYLKKAAAALKEKKYADAIKLVDEADEFTSNPQAYMIAGQSSQKLSKNSDAIKYFEKYLAAAPTAKNAGQIALTIGALYQQANNKAKAIEFYKKAVDAGVADAQQYIDALNK